MERRKIIDNCINERKGIPPAGASLLKICGHELTLNDFKQRAREPGWINGYKYGVEYETNGKKPDLPDDVIVEIYSQKGVNWSWGDIEEVSEWNWSAVTISHFRIVDERYKPVSEIPKNQQNVTILSEDNQNPENISDWYDYDKQQAIALPPVGVECECKNKNAQPNWAAGTDFHTTTPVFFGDELVVFKHKFGHETVGDHADYLFRPLDWNRKADEEKRKFVEAALAAAKKHKAECDVSFAEAMFKEGCRFAENKAAS